MGRDYIEEQTLLDLSRTQRLALAERWPLILLAAGEPSLAEEIRAVSNHGVHRMLPREHFKSDEEFISALRDWFAGQALVAVGGTSARIGLPAIAAGCYAMAAAMLAERAKAGA